MLRHAKLIVDGDVVDPLPRAAGFLEPRQRLVGVARLVARRRKGPRFVGPDPGADCTTRGTDMGRERTVVGIGDAERLPTHTLCSLRTLHTAPWWVSGMPSICQVEPTGSVPSETKVDCSFIMVPLESCGRDVT